MDGAVGNTALLHGVSVAATSQSVKVVGTVVASPTVKVAETATA
jgi:hypothetical protein